MATVQSATCTHCGAPLPISPFPQTIRCPFCGREQLVRPQNTAPPAPRPAPPPPPVPHFPAPPAAPPTAGSALIGFVILGAIVAAVGGALFFRAKAGSPTSQGSGPGSGGIVPPGERLQWSTSGPSVVPVAINADSIEDFVGRYHILDLKSSQQTTYIGAFDGKSFKRIWASESYGTLSQAASCTHIAVAAGKVLVTDFRARAHILELATGKELKTIALTDKARRVCAPSDETTKVWIEVADQQNVLVDLAAASAARGDRPASCAKIDDDEAPKDQGMHIRDVLKKGSNAVAIGQKSPGTPVPMAMGFDPTSYAVRWKTPIPPDPATASTSHPATNISADTFFATYELNDRKGSHLVAIDLVTGKRRWDTFLPRSESGSDANWLTATQSRVYVPHWTWLDIFDAASGKHLGTVGMW